MDEEVPRGPGHPQDGKPASQMVASAVSLLIRKANRRVYNFRRCHGSEVVEGRFNVIFEINARMDGQECDENNEIAGIKVDSNSYLYLKGIFST